MIQLKSISLAFGEHIIFDSVSAAFAQNQRIGLVGRNGAGKSTLLKIIAGQIQPDHGTVALAKELRIAYMPQEIVLLSQKTVLEEAFSVFDAHMQDEHTAYLFDSSAAQARTTRILKGLGFTEETMKKTVDTLSVGWRMRLVLAQLLLHDADFYLFDEPTNHLDIVTKEWFLQFLKNAKFGYLFISHDKYYLDQVCDFIFELERGKGTLFTGNFSRYLVLKEQQQEQIRATYERQSREVEQKMKTIERFRASATKASMAQSMLKQVEKIELVKPESPLASITFNFPPVQRPHSIVLTTEKCSYAYNNSIIFKGASLEVKRGEKVALIAANGKGKTTFLNCIMGKLAVQTGTITYGSNVQAAFFEQEQLAVLDPKRTVLEEVMYTSEASESLIRNFLGSFLFSGDDVHKKIAVLSGGERNRVAMVKVLLKNANLLILDEPTNHLDLYAKQVLLNALQQYQGTILFVSHDHEFLNTIATRIIELTPDSLYSYTGNYEAYLLQKQYTQSLKMTETNASLSDKKPNKTEVVYNASKIREIRKEITSLEAKITKHEQQLNEINELLVNAYGTPEHALLFDTLIKTQKIIDEATEKWETLQNALNN